eukprot:6996200-Alexandrium_andersonii.AAC.1
MAKILYHTDPLTMYGPLPDIAVPRQSLLARPRPPPGILPLRVLGDPLAPAGEDAEACAGAVAGEGAAAAAGAELAQALVARSADSSDS